MSLPVFALYAPSNGTRRHISHRCAVKELLLCIAVLALALVFAREAHASSTFTPTRFTVVDAGTAGKPDVLLIPGLSSSRAVWDAEATLFAPNYRLHLCDSLLFRSVSLVRRHGWRALPLGENNRLSKPSPGS